jgi:hypothetical protein
MKKTKIIIPIVILLIAIAGVATFFIIRNNKVKVDLNELRFNLKWGRERTDVDSIMYRQDGINKKTVDERLGLAYEFEDFLGVKGADGGIIMRFTEDDELCAIMYTFSDADSEAKTKIMESIEAEINAQYGECRNIAGAKIWVDDTTVVSIVGNHIVAFEDKKTVQEEILG